MSPMQRPLSGDVLVFHLSDEGEKAGDPALLERSGRNARTLLKEGPLRVTLVVIGPGGHIAEHVSEGPITVQPIRGRLRFTARGEDHELGAGDLLSAGPGIRHEVASEEGATFLLTVVAPPPGKTA